MNNPSIPRLGNQAISTASQQPMIMREGQMFHGQIKQLFPGQMAEVQIGGQKLMAKLEVPMKAGDAYYFQVKSVTPELQIKVVSGPLLATEGQAKQISNLMDSMQLPKSPEMVAVLNHFLKERLPVSKELLLNAADLLKTVQPSLRNEALAAIQKLVELKLPLNEINFKSLLGVEKKDGLHEVLHSVRNALAADTGIQTQTKERVLASISDTGKITAAAAERSLFSGAMLKLLDETVPREERFQLLQLLKNSGVMASKTTLANLQSVLHSAFIDSVGGNTNQTGSGILSGGQTMESRTVLPPGQMQTSSSSLVEAWKTVLQAESTRSSNDVHALFGQLKEMVKNTAVLQQPFQSQLIGLLEELESNPPVALRNSPIGEQVSKMLIRMNLDESRVLPFTTEESSAHMKTILPESVSTKLSELFRTMEQSPLPFAKELVQAAQAAVEQAIDGKVMKDVMQSLFKSLGFNYEAGLLNGNQDITKTLDMLKPQLVALLHDSAISPALRDAAETMIARMNGSLLQSSDSGMNQQIVMQLPLELFGKRIDATIQWSGRKKEDGKIDADFARILFYLELESINKTVVDMQVQNRVVAITVFNESHQVKEIGGLLQMKLKEGLESVDYRLSGVTFKPFVEEGKREAKRRNEMMSEQGGVDFRI